MHHRNVCCIPTQLSWHMHENPVLKKKHNLKLGKLKHCVLVVALGFFICLFVFVGVFLFFFKEQKLDLFTPFFLSKSKM